MWNIRRRFNSKKPKTSVCVLYINNYKGVINLVNLINGKLKTNKIDRLNLLIDWLNNAPLNEMISKNKLLFINLNIKKYPLNKEDLNNNAWLSGILDADGCFSIRHGLSKKNLITHVYARLSQSELDSWNKNNLFFMQEIAEYLCTTVKLNNRHNKDYLIRTTSKKVMIY